MMHHLNFPETAIPQPTKIAARNPSESPAVTRHTLEEIAVWMSLVWLASPSLKPLEMAEMNWLGGGNTFATIKSVRPSSSHKPHTARTLVPPYKNL
jgi:hypothetical protein